MPSPRREQCTLGAGHRQPHCPVLRGSGQLVGVLPVWPQSSTGPLAPLHGVHIFLVNGGQGPGPAESLPQRAWPWRPPSPEPPWSHRLCQYAVAAMTPSNLDSHTYTLLCGAWGPDSGVPAGQGVLTAASLSRGSLCTWVSLRALSSVICPASRLAPGSQCGLRPLSRPTPALSPPPRDEGGARAPQARCSPPGPRAAFPPPLHVFMVQ